MGALFRCGRGPIWDHANEETVGGPEPMFSSSIHGQGNSTFLSGYRKMTSCEEFHMGPRTYHVPNK